jgi:WD40 repeat protein
MSKLSLLITSSLGVLLLQVSWALSQVPEVKKVPAQADVSSEGLPPGAIVRLGTARFRHAEEVLSVAFSPDGKVLASGDQSGHVHLWDAATGQPGLDLPKNTGSLVLFTPDGNNLVCSGGEKGLVLHNAVTGEMVRTYGNNGQERNRGRGVRVTHSVALSPDGKVLAEADGQEVVLWETTTGKELRRLKGDKAPFGSVAFSHDGKTVAAGDDSTNTTIYFWDAKTGEAMHLARTGERGCGRRVPGSMGVAGREGESGSLPR